MSLQSLYAQDVVSLAEKEAAYTRTINTRAEKIVATLNISDSLTAKHATSVIADQYRNLNNVYMERDQHVKAIKEKGKAREIVVAEFKKVNDAASEKVSELHKSFVAALSSFLSSQQVTKVKDGMTYNVLSVTYSAYVDMIPTLKQQEKDQIMTWLVEAREIAMDAESSEKKHWWFGKYKGRINNYLSAQGYDVTEERKEWEKRKNLKQSTSN